MSLLKVIAALLLAATSTKGSVVGPAFAPAPVVGPAISYTHAVPYNVPPFADSVNIFTRHFPAPILHAAPLAALHGPILPGVIPQARSIHPPSFLHAAPVFRGPLPYALGAPLPHHLGAPLAHAFGGPVPAPLPHAIAAPLPPAIGAPLPHVHGAPLPHALGAHIAHAIGGPVPHALGAPLPHALAGPLPHALPHGGPLPQAYGAPPVWRR